MEQITLQQYLEELNEEQRKRRWIPVEERLQQMDEDGIPPDGYWGCRQQRELDRHMTDTGFWKDIYGYGWGE